MTESNCIYCASPLYEGARCGCDPETIALLKETVDALLVVLAKVKEFFAEADFDFRNGNIHNGIDEGEVMGWNYLGLLEKQLDIAVAEVEEFIDE